MLSLFGGSGAGTIICPTSRKYLPVEAPIEKTGDPDKRGVFKDFAGTIWNIPAQMRQERF